MTGTSKSTTRKSKGPLVSARLRDLLCSNIHDDTPEPLAQTYISLATIGWNLATLPDELKEPYRQSHQSFLEHAYDSDAAAKMWTFVEDMEYMKGWLFPKEKRYIMGARVERTADGSSYNIVCSHSRVWPTSGGV
jgi:hypothetical protein